MNDQPAAAAKPAAASHQEYPNVHAQLLEPETSGAPAVRPSALPPPSPNSPLPNTTTRTRRLWWAGGAALLAVLALVLLRGKDAPPPTRDQRAIPVRAEALVLGDLEIFSTYAGELVGEVADIAPRVGGLVREVYVRIGDRVGAGSVLAVIDDVDLRNQFEEAKGLAGVAAANRRKAAAELERAEADHHRSADLFRGNLISEQEYARVTSQLAANRAGLAAADAQVEQARARQAILAQQLAETRLTAPFAGVIAARYLDRGALIQPGTAVIRLVEHGRLHVQFGAPERDLASLRPGVPFKLTTQATGAQQFAGTVSSVAGEISRTDRTVLVEGLLEHPAELLRTGMYADVTVSMRQIDNAMLVPGEAVLERIGMDGASSVGVFRAQGTTAQWVPVEVVGRSGGRAAIAGALAAGDRVLTLGHTDLRDGSAISISADAATPKEG